MTESTVSIFLGGVGTGILIYFIYDIFYNLKEVPKDPAIYDIYTNSGGRYCYGIPELNRSSPWLTLQETGFTKSEAMEYCKNKDEERKKLNETT